MISAYVERGELVVRDVLRAHAEVLLSDGRVLSTLDGSAPLTLDVTDGDDIVVRLRYRNTEPEPVSVEQLRPLVAPRGFRELPLAQLLIRQTGWQSWSRSHPPAPFASNVQTAAPPIRGPWLPHRSPDGQVEPWLATLQAPHGQALLLGFLSGRDQLGTVEIVPDGAGQRILAATELDGMPLAPGEEMVSEPLMLAVGAESELLARYAERVATSMGARAQAEVLSGWCSWYQLYTGVTEGDILRNLNSLAARRDLLPLRLIQLDDGYQHAVGDWLELNQKFPNGLRSLVGAIHDSGYLAGVWLAPFLLSADSHTFAAHPDWVVRDQHGEPLNAIDNWGSANYAVDTTHPGAMEWLEHVIHTLGDDWGFDYLKLDFVYAGAMRGQRFDRTLTGNGAFRRGMQRLRQAAGDRFILGCGAPLLASVGLVDGMRIGSDVAAFWGREGNADGPSLRNATRATLARMWLHGQWWLNDPDCVVIRSDDTQLSLAEVEAWMTVVAMSGGMPFVGDDVSRVEESRLALFARLLPASGQAALACGPLNQLLPERLHLRVEREWGAWSVVAVANWSDAPAEARFDAGELGLTGPVHVLDQWSGEYLGKHTRAVALGSLPPHALRLLAVHPDLGRPQTIGSLGHLLGDAMDLAAERWDPASRVLTLLPRADGPPARTGELIVFDPDGPLRRVPFVSGDAAIRLDFGTLHALPGQDGSTS